MNASLWAACLFSAAIAGAQTQFVRDFNLPAQPLSVSLRDVGAQAHVNVFFDAPKVEGRIAPAIRIRGTADEALTALLNTSGLRHRFLNEHTVVLAEENGEATTSASATGGDETKKITESTARTFFSSQTERRGEDGRNGDAENLSVKPDMQDEASRSRDRDVEEVLVTGTHIRGAQSVGSELISFSRDDIDRAGFATTNELLQNLPQNFGAGAQEDPNSIDQGAGANIGFGSGVNLRGLGNDSTLVLLNGRRLPLGGGGAYFVDVSMIPLTAIERVDVLTDGASALYGSDAIGGVVNFVMRDHYDGAETRARFGSVTDGNAQEFQLGQVLGSSWETGHLLVAYEFYKRDNLASASRNFAASSNLTEHGGDDYRSTASNPGNITDFDFIQNFAIPSGQNGKSLTAADLTAGAYNLQNLRQDTDILPQQKTNSVFATVSHSPSTEVQLFADIHASKRSFQSRSAAESSFLTVSSTNPFYVNPFGGSDPVIVSYSFIDDLGPKTARGNVTAYGGTTGASFAVSSSWSLETYGSYAVDKESYTLGGLVDSSALDVALADSDPLTAFNPFGDGSFTNLTTLNFVRAFEVQENNSKLTLLHAKVDGSLFSIMGGVVKTALGIEYREESFDYLAVQTSQSFSELLQAIDGSRTVRSAFGEIYIPIVTDKNALPGTAKLEVSIAERLERYSDFGSTSEPRIGFSWKPVKGVTVTGTVGSSFRAPLLSQLKGNRDIYLLPDAPDNSSPSGRTNVLALVGRQEGLKPEKADTWTAGIRFRPSMFEGLDFKIGYFHIDIKDRIQVAVDNFFSALAQPQIYQSVIQRNPSLEQVTALFSDPAFHGVPISPDEIGAIIDGRIQNIAVSHVRGIDATATKAFAISHGSLDLQLTGTYILTFAQGINPAAPLIERVSTFGNPPDLRLRGGASWKKGSFSATASVNYTDDYVDSVSNLAAGRLPRRVASYTTADVQLAYSFDKGLSPESLSGLAASLNVQNFFDRQPPFVNGFGIGYDALNASPLGRFVSMQLSKAW